MYHANVELSQLDGKIVVQNEKKLPGQKLDEKLIRNYRIKQWIKDKKKSKQVRAYQKQDCNDNLIIRKEA